MATLQNIYKVTKEQYDKIVAGTFEGHTYDENGLYLVEKSMEKYATSEELDYYTTRREIETNYLKAQKLYSTNLDDALYELTNDGSKKSGHYVYNDEEGDFSLIQYNAAMQTAIILKDQLVGFWKYRDGEWFEEYNTDNLCYGFFNVEQDGNSVYFQDFYGDGINSIDFGDLAFIDLVDSKIPTQYLDLSDYATQDDLANAVSDCVLEENLETVALSGSYNDLKDKPTIPTAVTENTVSGWGFTKNTGTYSKPSGGIPDSDIASASAWNNKVDKVDGKGLSTNDFTDDLKERAEYLPYYIFTSDLMDATVLGSVLDDFNSTSGWSKWYAINGDLQNIIYMEYSAVGPSSARNFKWWDFKNNTYKEPENTFIILSTDAIKESQIYPLSSYLSINGGTIKGSLRIEQKDSNEFGSIYGNLYGTVYGTASSATSATQDSNGNNIAETYATKAEALSITDLGRHNISGLNTTDVLNYFITRDYKTQSGYYKFIDTFANGNQEWLIKYSYTENHSFEGECAKATVITGSDIKTCSWTLDGGWVQDISLDTTSRQTAAAFKDASVNGKTLTFTKNDGTAKDITLPDLSSIIDLGTLSGGVSESTLLLTITNSSTYKTTSGVYKAIGSSMGFETTYWVLYNYNDNNNYSGKEYADAVITRIGSGNTTSSYNTSQYHWEASTGWVNCTPVIRNQYTSLAIFNSGDDVVFYLNNYSKYNEFMLMILPTNTSDELNAEAHFEFEVDQADSITVGLQVNVGRPLSFPITKLGSKWLVDLGTDLGSGFSNQLRLLCTTGEVSITQGENSLVYTFYLYGR